MKIISNSEGFSPVAIVLSIAVIIILGLVSYNVYSDNNNVVENDSSTLQPIQENTLNPNDDVAKAPEIQNAADLEEAAKALDSITIESSSEQQLDQDLNF